MKEWKEKGKKKIKEGRSLIFQAVNLNRAENIAGKIRLCKPDL